MAKIIGRKEEVTLLQSIQQADKSAFVAVYGRRRVGKTFLIRSFYNGEFISASLKNGSSSFVVPNLRALLAKSMQHLCLLSISNPKRKSTSFLPIKGC